VVPSFKVGLDLENNEKPLLVGFIYWQRFFLFIEVYCLNVKSSNKKSFPV